MAITNNRIFIIHNGIFSKKIISINYDTINSIDFSTGLTNGKISVNSYGVNYDLKNIMNKSVEPVVSLIKKYKHELSFIKTKNHEEVQNRNDELSKLERLFSLKEKGAISEHEYTEQKNKLLSSFIWAGKL